MIQIVLYSYFSRICTHNTFRIDLLDSACAQVIVADANDNAPVFTYPNATHSLLQVLMSTPLDAPLAFVHASDADAGANGSVNYSLVSGNVGGLFQLHPLSGRLSLARSLRHDANLIHFPNRHTLLMLFSLFVCWLVVHEVLYDSFGSIQYILNIVRTVLNH